jgi:hypothetical protein
MALKATNVSFRQCADVKSYTFAKTGLTRRLTETCVVVFNATRVDSYLLTGMVLGGAGGRQTRVWRFTPSMTAHGEHNPISRFVSRREPSLVLVRSRFIASPSATVLLSHLYIKTNILPRQARDEHRESSSHRKPLAFNTTIKSCKTTTSSTR